MQVVKAGKRRSSFFQVGAVVYAICMCSQKPAFAGPVLPLPDRPATAASGTKFYERIQNLPDVEREQAISIEVRAGNVPTFLRRLIPISVEVTPGGATHRGRYFVTPDYLAIGSDTDYFRMPMSAPLAQQVADICSCTLPTRKMVNDIYAQSKGKLSPTPFSPAQFEITSPTVWWMNNRAIEDQRSTCPAQLGELIAGIKKDIVITPLLLQRPPPPRVAIYGWHKLDGKEIQPLSLVHKANYKDYSHGVRLVWQQLEVDGRETTVGAVLADPERSALLSDEGATTITRYP